MTAVIYRPENVIKNKNQESKIISKHCAASALANDQEYIKKAVLVAAKKQGLSNDTDVIALCDGADNCWNIAESLRNHCSSLSNYTSISILAECVSILSITL